jgi:hypothetical protein
VDDKSAGGGVRLGIGGDDVVVVGVAFAASTVFPQPFHLSLELIEVRHQYLCFGGDGAVKDVRKHLFYLNLCTLTSLQASWLEM